MIVSDTAIRQRVSVLVLAAIILIFGTYCYNVLPRESDPDITISNVFVSTSYKGIASKDIETSITIEIENSNTVLALVLVGCNNISLQPERTNFHIFIGYRFNAPKQLSKPIDSIEDKIPILKKDKN